MLQKNQKSSKMLLPFIALIIVIFVWGIDPVVFSYFYIDYSATLLCAISTFTSAIVFLFIARKSFKKIDKKFLKVAIPIAVLNSTGALIQKIGLQYTTPAYYSFLEYISCAVAPIILIFITKKVPKLMQVLSIVLCIAGTFIISGMLNETFKFSIGEVLCGLSGVIFGVSIAITGTYAKDIDLNLLTAFHMILYFIISVILTILLNYLTVNGEPLEAIKFTLNPMKLIPAALFGLLTIGICWTLKNNALTKLNPILVTLFTPLSAVLSGTLSVILKIDTLSLNLVIGAVLIITASIISGISDVKDEKLIN